MLRRCLEKLHSERVVCVRDTICDVLKFLIVVLLNLCVTGFVALLAARNADIPALSMWLSGL